MRLSPNEDQTQILDFVDSLTRPYAAPPLHDTSFALESAELDRELEEGGFLDVAQMPELGAVTAALVVERLARLPFAVEAAATALVALATERGTTDNVSAVVAAAAPTRVVTALPVPAEAPHRNLAAVAVAAIVVLVIAALVAAWMLGLLG